MTHGSAEDSLRALHAVLDRLVGADFDPRDLRSSLREVARAEARLASLKLMLVASAEAAEVAREDGSTDTGAWAVRAVGGNRSRAWGAVWLAGHLHDTYQQTAAALAEGRISEEHASIIVRAAERVPDGVTAEELAHCEEALVAKAESMKPSALRRAARRLLEPINRRLADEHQETELRADERHAERETWLWLDDNGDGTWTGKFTIPELQAHTLLSRLEALSAPRRTNRNSLGQTVQDETVPGMGSRYNRTEALGLAFLELIEHLPVDGHARSSYALVVHVSEEQVRNGAGAAVLETGAELSIGEARRLACGAGILPLVLSGESVPLDLGREQRLFTRHQAIALSSQHEHCAAEGCERPFAWCELHHLRPWSADGPTDLDNAVPLCGFHHRRVHDEHYSVARAPDGSLRFTHRWPSRRRQHDLAA